MKMNRQLFKFYTHYINGKPDYQMNESIKIYLCRRRIKILKICRLILAIIGISTATYSLLTETFDLVPYTMLCLGVMILVMGLEEYKKGKKGFWYMSIIVSLLLFFVSIQDLLLS